MKRYPRAHPLWLAFVVHRLSGLALAIFLPLHFLMLGSALNGPAGLDSALKLTTSPMAKVAEYGLVFLLAVHLFGGLRLLAMELLPWRAPQKTWAALAVACAFLISMTFLMKAI